MAPGIVLPEFGTPIGMVVVCFSALSVLYIFHSSFFRVPRAKGVPLLRERPGKTTFSLKNRLSYFTGCEAIYREAYHGYCKKGKAVIIPGIGFRDETILPVTSIHWASSQPESVLSNNEAFLEVNQTNYSLGHTKYVGDPWQSMLVKREMNAVLENIVASLNEELQVAFDAYFGTDENSWKRINLLSTVRMVVAQAASRFTVGLPLCRNGQYLKDSLAAIDGCVINAAITGGMPPMLRPFVGRLAGMKTRLAQRKVRRHLEPTYRTRLEAFKNTQHDVHHIEPQDHLQLMLRYAQRERPEELYNLDVISRRLTAANFGSMHQTSIQVTNMLLNILGSDAEYNTIEVLRDEATRIMGKDKEWTKAKICKMNKADSVARETMRCHSFGTRSILRKVMVHGLVTDTGIELPKGSMISFLAQPAQMDVETYEEPHKYDPFRFSRMRDAATNSAKANTLSFVSTGSNYLPFGHGRHACPGRFLLDFELKMIIAYVLRNYDLKFPEEYNGKRPANKWLGEANIPPEGVNLLVKRRMDSI